MRSLKLWLLLKRLQVEAILCLHKGEISPLELVEASAARIEATDGAFGMAAGCAYAEGFISQRSQTYDYLPLSDHTLERATLSDHEKMAITSFRTPVD